MRARRKRIFRKMGVDGCGAVLARFLQDAQRGVRKTGEVPARCSTPFAKQRAYLSRLRAPSSSEPHRESEERWRSSSLPRTPTSSWWRGGLTRSSRWLEEVRARPAVRLRSGARRPVNRAEVAATFDAAARASLGGLDLFVYATGILERIREG